MWSNASTPWKLSHPRTIVAKAELYYEKALYLKRLQPLDFYLLGFQALTTFEAVSLGFARVLLLLIDPILVLLFLVHGIAADLHVPATTTYGESHCSSQGVRSAQECRDVFSKLLDAMFEQI